MFLKLFVTECRRQPCKTMPECCLPQIVWKNAKSVGVCLKRYWERGDAAWFCRGSMSSLALPGSGLKVQGWPGGWKNDTKTALKKWLRFITKGINKPRADSRRKHHVFQEYMAVCQARCLCMWQLCLLPCCACSLLWWGKWLRCKNIHTVARLVPI